MHSASIPPRNQSTAAAGRDSAQTPPDLQPREKPAAFPTGELPCQVPGGSESPAAFAKPTYDELRALVQKYDVPAVPRRSVARAGIIAVIFVVGSALGVALSSFLDRETPQDWHSSFRSDQSFKNGVAGTSKSELPYDGRVDQPVRKEQSDAGLVGNAELPYDGVATAGKALAQPSAPEPEPAIPASSDPALQLSRSGELPQPSAGSPPRAAANTVVTRRKPVTPKRPPSADAGQKNREIDRIRRQADEELKKKNGLGTDSPRKAGRDSPGQKLGRKGAVGHKTKLPPMAAMLEQCEQAGNFILREQCKWQLCGGKWGKSGCPSYSDRLTNLN